MRSLPFLASCFRATLSLATLSPALLFASACASEKPPPVQTAPPKVALETDFQMEAERFYWTWLEHHPAKGVSLGYHQYDGALPDVSASGLKAFASWLHGELERFEKVSTSALTAVSKVERAVVLSQIRGALFDLEVRRSPWRNPMTYIDALDLVPYVSREYKPVDERVRAMATLCRRAGEYLASARANLEPAIPRTWLDTALMQVSGLISFAERDVRTVVAGASTPALKELDAALAPYVANLGAFRTLLKERLAAATSDYALGDKAFLQMLATTEAVEVDLATLQKVADDDLARNTKALEDVAKAIAPKKSIRDVVRMVEDDRPKADEVLAAATEQVTGLRRSITEKTIVTIPSDDAVEVRDSPPHMRWNAAFLSAAGPFETAPLPSFYYISPPDPKWPAAEQRAYIPPRAPLMFTTIHEVWPGHFLHSLHRRQNPSRILKSFGSYAFTEGWAHYAEEMMWEQGATGHDPRMRVGQLLEALLRNVRFVSAIGLHAKGMTVEQSIELFQQKGFCDPATARQQAVRGTFDPMYLSYTLGKIMIRKMRDEWSHRSAGDTSLRGFHDRLLSFGGAPVPVIRAAMLGDQAGPAL